MSAGAVDVSTRDHVAIDAGARGQAPAPSREDIRIATAEDAPELLELLHAAYGPIRELGIRFTAATADLQQVEQVVRRHTTFVLRRDGAIAGTVSVRFPWAGGDTHITSYPFIHWFAVAPALKRQSIGARILDHAENAFLRDQIKAPAVYLATATRHPWLVGLYERRGYEGFYKHISKGDEILYLRRVLHPALYAALDRAEHKRFADAGSTEGQS
ncbi:MAG: GNAT family N-acetyltransferase [Pseudochelatococcus sp.]|jgi:GNAT superfamily N-acetyltransferase|uniref:GNAT family N-acetyltransferase n=1 Tax=Pseudochelatococcus sp. TaxID=2020869 RepID=UPI003D8BD221